MTDCLNFLNGQKKTISMQTYKKLLIIGNGNWGNKVKNALNKNFPSMVVDIVSYRMFSENSINKYSCIWICNRSENHFNLLEQIKNFSGKIIMEKPISLNIKDYEEIKSISLFKNNQIVFSKIWSFSEIWKEFCNNSLDNFKKIECERFGNSFALDWLPHDIFLLSDMLNSDLSDYSKKINNYSNSLIDLDLITNTIKIKICTGIGSRSAKWNIYGNNGITTIDFLNGKIYKDKTLNYTTFKNMDAISEFYKNINNVSLEENIKDLSAQQTIFNYILNTQNH